MQGRKTTNTNFYRLLEADLMEAVNAHPTKQTATTLFADTPSDFITKIKHSVKS